MSTRDSQSASPLSSTEAVEQHSGTLHEVSNALTVVLGWLDMAARASSLEESRDAIRVAQEHARRGQVMARRSIGADEASSLQSRTASEIASFAATSVEPKAKRGEVSIVTELGSGTDIRIESDASVLQILTNLLLNAIDFAPTGSQVTLSVRRAELGLVYRVQDEGPGVPTAALSDLFTAPTSTRAGGAGIGLPYSRRLALDHDGDLRLVPPHPTTPKTACDSPFQD